MEVELNSLPKDLNMEVELDMDRFSTNNVGIIVLLLDTLTGDLGAISVSAHCYDMFLNCSFR